MKNQVAREQTTEHKQLTAKSDEAYAAKGMSLLNVYRPSPPQRSHEGEVKCTKSHSLFYHALVLSYSKGWGIMTLNEPGRQKFLKNGFPGVRYYAKLYHDLSKTEGTFVAPNSPQKGP